MGMFRIYIPKVTSLAPAFHQFFATKENMKKTSAWLPYCYFTFYINTALTEVVYFSKICYCTSPHYPEANGTSLAPTLEVHAVPHLPCCYY